jgi:zinc transport system substrate-binding protein
MKRFNLIAFFLVLVSVAAWLFYSTKHNTDTNKTSSIKTVVVSTYPAYFVASKIAGSDFKVVNISANAADAHDFEPTVQDIYTLKSADLAFISGVHLDDWAIKGAEQNNTINMSKYVKVDGENPHYWMSFENLKLMSTLISKKLSELKPENSAVYTKNNQEFSSEIDTVSKGYMALKECKNKNIFVSHDAFGYMTKPLGINVIAIHDDEHTHGEPSLASMAKSIKEAKNANIHTVFYESDETKKMAEMAAKELGANVKFLFTMEATPIKEMDFTAMMKENLKNLKEAMDCK